MNKALYLAIWFISLVLLQVFVFNNILFLGFINPYMYVVFVIFHPLKKERILFLFLSFLLGLSIDIFSDSGGINAFALLFIAYLRLFFIRVIFKKTEQDFAFFDLQQEPFGKVFNYVIILIIIHHFILFSLANFSTQNFSSVLLNTLYSSIFTLVLFFLGSFIFRRKK